METVPTAHILTIDIGRLHNGDKEEASKLLNAAKKDGIFYLDLENQLFMGVIDTLDKVFALSKELFDLSEEEKMEYDIDKLSKLKLNGYIYDSAMLLVLTNPVQIQASWP